MLDRPTNNPPWHAPGGFDDPFMIPERSPEGSGNGRRWPALAALAVMLVVIALLVVLFLA